MHHPSGSTHRRTVLAALGLGGLLLPMAARAQLGGLRGLGGAGLGGGLTGLLGHASDSALDKLSQPGAFYNDKSIRILLPLVAGSAGGGGLGGLLGDMMTMGDKLGVTDQITRTINDAAGRAAHAAKPVFRTAINRLTISDVPGIVGQGDGATQYLRRSAGDELSRHVRPLIDDALGNAGAYRQLDRLNRTSRLFRAAGLTHERLGSSVTEQAMNGIFKYMGGEERTLRANPLGPAGSLLKGMMGGGG